MIKWKLGCRSRKQKRKNQPIAKSGIELCHWFILPLVPATLTKQFSLDRKQQRHKQDQYSASESVGLIFTRSYRSTTLLSDYDSITSENQPLIRPKQGGTVTALLPLTAERLRSIAASWLLKTIAANGWVSASSSDMTLLTTAITCG